MDILNLNLVVEATTSANCIDFSGSFSNFSSRRMDDKPSIKNQKNQHIRPFRYDSTAEFRLNARNLSRYSKCGVTRSLLGAAIIAALLYPPVSLYAASLAIPQIPLVIASPTHPQVLILIGNSQSMDGNFSGAIMTGTGSLSSSLTSLYNSSSPINYTVPAGFTPPVQGPDVNGLAPYTVIQGGMKIDNSPSRLNVAKAAVKAIIENYIATTDFALGTYSTSNISVYSTWVYYMSPESSNFVFTNTPIEGNRYVINPCYNYGSATSTVASNCSSLATLYGSSVLSSSQYMQIGTSSDDPLINDVLFASGGLPGVFVSYNGPTPSNPYPPNYTLSNYNQGNIRMTYANTRPSIGNFTTSPTNAGFVPFSPQVMYAQRGFAYYSNNAFNTGNIRINMTSAGINPTPTSVTNALNAFLPSLAPETNSTSTLEIKASAPQSPLGGLLTRANSFMKTVGTTSGNCPQKKYIVLISDGLPTQDLQGRYWPPLGSAAAVGYGVTATFNADGTLNSTNDQALSDAINEIINLKNNKVTTFVIGLGAGVDPSVNPQAAATLTALAVAGGSENYYPATNPEELVNSFNAILSNIQNGSFSTTASTVSSNRINTNTVAYQANFTTKDTPYDDWTGNLIAIKLDPNTGIPTSTILWSAQSQLDSLTVGTGWSTNRKIATWDPLAAVGVPFRWTDINTIQQGQLQSSDQLGEQRLEYIRGNATLEKRNGGTFRNRSHILGDIVDSQVIYVASPQAPYLTTSYIDFAKANVNRLPTVYVGANDGMLHAFNTTTGQELFSFVPNAVFKNLDQLTSTLYNQNHLFFVNGSPESSDVQFLDGSWHTILVGGENAGGQSIYAIDITHPTYLSTESALANAVLWEFTDTDLGLTYSIPKVGQIRGVSSSSLKFAVFFGNGYNNLNNTAVLYAVDPQTGSLIRKIDLCAAVPTACDVNLPQGLSTVALAQKDGLQAEPITVVYAGDLQGNLWAIDVASSDPTSWSTRLLFQAKDSTGVSQPITTAPIVTLNPNFPRRQGLFVLFGTGQLLTTSDLANNQTQTIYGIWDVPLSSTTYTRSDLQQQILTVVNSSTSGLSTNIITATANTINWNNKVGWFADLPIAGQRVVSAPELINGAFIATLNTPPLNSCGFGFSSMLLELNFLNGGAFQYARFDLNGDSAFNVADKYNGVYPVGIGLSNSYANAPTILGPDKNNNLVILITLSDRTQTTVIAPNITPRKVGWWQIN
ncbi:type IV fimbrial biogenesis PilY1-like protein [Legionella gratiana]|uniref:Type IV fimbrial biogenesis PilY1-like protein n=1 Tax=Legionella gratiana TaxID=45066 RepID=A0A378JC11_9GAMM|nr:PilC/PilY family type IV pilus protein [Legionella gratiana]KTD05512.1 type IV fimbrial biogenesis PilY1-like protein [Legionella gratiana]STX45414.1 type IV fimbrial biogenesis PilY1-like protein [Legionella gratiana]